MKLIKPFFLCCLLAAAQASAQSSAPASATASAGANASTSTAANTPMPVAASTKTYSAAHLSSAARVIKAMALPERFIIPSRQLLQNSLEKDPENAPIMASTMEPYLQKDYTVQQLKGYFASQFDPAMSKKIAEFWEGPVGKKMAKAQVHMLTTGEPLGLAFTSKEKAIMQRFDKTAAGQAFVAAMPQIEETFEEYMKNTHTRMREQFLINLEKKLRPDPA